MTFRVILVVTLVCSVLAVIGIATDRAGFIGNLIAGVIEVITTVTIIEWLLQRQRLATPPSRTRRKTNGP